MVHIYPNYYMLMRVKILNPNFSIKDGVKSVSKTQKKNCLPYIKDYGTVNAEPIKAVDKEALEFQLTMSLTEAC